MGLREVVITDGEVVTIDARVPAVWLQSGTRKVCVLCGTPIDRIWSVFGMHGFGECIELPDAGPDVLDWGVFVSAHMDHEVQRAFARICGSPSALTPPTGLTLCFD